MTRLLRHTSLARIILLLGVALSLLAWFFVSRLVDRQARADFDTKVQATVSAIELRTQRYIDLLDGLEGLFGHDLSVSRAGFQRYVNSLNLPTRFPGVQAIEYVRRVKQADKPAYQNMVRADRSVNPAGYPEFSVKTDRVDAEYYVIHYVEPMLGNELVFGLDIRSRDGSRIAAERARDAGQPTATGRYQLAQEKQKQLGLVVYQPIYETYRQTRTLEQRRTELAGFVNIVFRVDDLFTELVDRDRRNGLHFQVFDVGESSADAQQPADANLLYSSDRSEGPRVADSETDVSHPIIVAGRRWLFKFSGLGVYGHPLLHPLSLLTLFSALLISLLLYVLLRTLSRSRWSAQRMADSATRDLRDQLGFSQQLLEVIPNPVFFKDVEGRFVSCNHAFEEFSSRPRSEFIGKTASQATTSEAASIHHEHDTYLLKNKGARTYELSLTRTTDGKQIDAIYNKAAFVDADGKVTGIVGVVIDISERKALERTLAESNEKLRSIIEASPLAIVARNLDNVITLWNPAAESIFGWKAEQVLGTKTSIIPDYIKLEAAAMRRQAQQGLMLALEETRRMRKDGTILDVSLSVAPIRNGRQDIVGTMALIGDVSRRKKAEDALRESEAQLRLAMEAANMGSWYWNVGSGNITFSDGFGPLFGLPRGTFFSGYDEFMEAIHPDDRAETDVVRQRAMTSEDNFDMECRVVWPDQSIHWLAVKGQAKRAASGLAERVVGVTTDITTRKRAEQRIAFLAHHDALTGLPNRILLQDRIGQAIALSHRHNTRVAVLFIDLDHFKNINDSLGHQVGDQLLQMAAARIQSCLREVDTVSRLGGDEFVIVVPELADGTEGNDLSAVAIKLLDTLSTNFHLQSHDLHIGASIGISIYPNDGENAETLMRNADTAMYHAKENGRSQYQFFTNEMNIAAQQRMSLQTLLRRSLQSNDFSLHYQPLFSAVSPRLLGFEALLRWRNPNGVIVRPAEFISVAEDSGLIIPIGEWVIREACQTAARWQKSGYPLRMSVNVSALQLRRKSFVDMVKSALAESGAEPRLLEIEITERVIVGGHEQAISALREIDALGIQIAIDDFGTGYSGLSYLKQFPIDTVKIDQSFIRDLTVDADDEAIVRAIIAMSKSLKLNIVAEGVEHAEQLSILKDLGCDMVQGYYFSPPLAMDEADAFIAARMVYPVSREP